MKWLCGGKSGRLSLRWTRWTDASPKNELTVPRREINKSCVSTGTTNDELLEFSASKFFCSQKATIRTTMRFAALKQETIGREKSPSCSLVIAILEDVEDLFECGCHQSRRQAGGQRCPT